MNRVFLRLLRLLLRPLLAFGVCAMAVDAHGQSWRRLNTDPPFLPVTSLLLTDGSVLVQGRDPVTTLASRDWWRLIPDEAGSYQNGRWAAAASLPEGYAPLYFASAVLADGRVLVEGGEYVGSDFLMSNQGAIYDPVADQWTSVAPPDAWTSIGDAPGVVLADGMFMIGRPYTREQALFDPRSLSWVATGAGKADEHTEEGWTLLPSGDVLVVDISSQDGNSERYHPQTGTWTSAGSTIVPLSSIFEIGPAILRPDGTVFATGDNGNTAIYCSGCESSCQPGWRVGPTFPELPGLGQVDMADAPAVLLPDGNVLLAASPGFLNPPIIFFEFDGQILTRVPAPSAAATDLSSFSRLLLLPTGEVLFTDGTTDVEIFRGEGRPDWRWAPKITRSPKRVRRGDTYEIVGRQFNGLSQANAYGDDVQNATNYPLVRIVHDATRHVTYARTHDHSTMAVATKDRIVSTYFDVPTGIEPGPSHLVVVANGIPSDSVRVWVEY